LNFRTREFVEYEIILRNIGLFSGFWQTFKRFFWFRSTSFKVTQRSLYTTLGMTNDKTNEEQLEEVQGKLESKFVQQKCELAVKIENQGAELAVKIDTYDSKMDSNYDKIELRMQNVENQISEINTNIKDLLNFLKKNKTKTE
jgi:hypothetical protein